MAGKLKEHEFQPEQAQDEGLYSGPVTRSRCGVPGRQEHVIYMHSPLTLEPETPSLQESIHTPPWQEGAEGGRGCHWVRVSQADLCDWAPCPHVRGGAALGHLWTSRHSAHSRALLSPDGGPGAQGLARKLASDLKRHLDTYLPPRQTPMASPRSRKGKERFQKPLSSNLAPATFQAEL